MYKVCPTCRSNNLIDAPVCQCGHVFRTQFTQPQTQQTQAFQGPLQPQPQPQQQVQAPYFQPVATYSVGPRDEFEWKMTTFWLWFFMFVCANFLYGSIRLNFALLWPFCVLFTILMCVLGVRLRRLYVYHPIPTANPLLTISSLLVFLLVATIAGEFSAARIRGEDTKEAMAPAFDDRARPTREPEYIYYPESR